MKADINYVTILGQKLWHATIIFGLISLFLAPGSIALGAGLVGGISIFIGIVLVVIIFIVGVFIGDFLEGVLRK